MKIAFDENMPAPMARMFQSLASEKRFRNLTGDFTFESARDYTPKKEDSDYLAKNDVPWIKRFSSSGGRVIISGNTKMKTVPHERLALVQENMIVIFFEPKWNNLTFFKKSALLLHWWPAVVRTIENATPGSFWHIPLSFGNEETLRPVSNENLYQKRREKQESERDNIIAARKAKRSPRKLLNERQGDLLGQSAGTE